MPKIGCPSSCGGVDISYPFGIGDGCFYNEYFELTCNNTYDPPKLFTGNVEVVHIAPKSPKIKVIYEVSHQCYDDDSSVSKISLRLAINTYKFSYTENVFTAVGCDTWAFINGIRDFNYTGGCISSCSSEIVVSDGDCSGIGCCQTSIPKGLQGYETDFKSRYNHSSVKSFNPCSYSFMVEKSKYNFIKADMKMNKSRVFPVVLDWVIGNNSCEIARKNKSDYACKSNHSECYSSTDGPGYNCNCSHGFDGNPYLKDGCQDIDECNEMKSPCARGGICKNNEGNYTCTCPSGTKGDPYKGECYKDDLTYGLIVGLSIGISLLSLLIFIGCGILIYKRLKKAQKKKLRRKNFILNNKLLEMELISHGDTTERIKTFTLKEMEKATNQFDKTRIIGEGGHGTVYKGLLSDQRVTAIKASKVMNQREKEEFINEVALLSRIYHWNVVMLYGCCLETEIPLLAYEFISNGTLSDYLHARNPDPSSYLCWADRLRIAIEVSAAIAYLHSASLKTIFHRDLKSANILLDEKLTAKLSDFGASKFIGSDQTHITATIQGTFGYFDPEYFQSGKLTEKSDVYSLGVILVELFTGENPISNERSQEKRNIIMHFIKLLNENQVEQILDTRVVKEALKEEIEDFVTLAGSCLRFKGEERPTMMEVVSTLEGIKRFKRKKKDKILNEEAKHLLSFDISRTENSSWSTTGSFATAKTFN